jgi:hypothetical protein
VLENVDEQFSDTEQRHAVGLCQIPVAKVRPGDTPYVSDAAFGDGERHLPLIAEGG